MSTITRMRVREGAEIPCAGLMVQMWQDTGEAEIYVLGGVLVGHSVAAAANGFVDVMVHDVQPLPDEEAKFMAPPEMHPWRKAPTPEAAMNVFSFRVRWFHQRDGVWRQLRATGCSAHTAIEAQVARFDRHGIEHGEIEVLFGPETDSLIH